MSLYGVLKTVFKPFFMLTFGVRVKGLENVPEDRGFLICANHTSMLDVVMLGAVFEQRLNFMAKKEIFKFPPFAAFFRAVGAFPVNRGGADVHAIKTAVTKVENKEAICIFPQGTRRKGVDPSTTPVRGGVGLIAYHTGCAVVPVYIKTKGNHVRIFKKTEIIIGKPLENNDFAFEKGCRSEYDRAAKLVFSKICALGGYNVSDKTSKITDKEATGEEKLEN